MIFRIILTFVLVLTSIPYAQAQASRGEGVGNTGGGEPRSQELYNLIHSTPLTISAKGPQMFPEIDITELKEFLQNNPIQVELDSNITFAGKPKMSRCSSENGIYKVTLDPDMWDEVGRKVNGEMIKRAHAFHELLCLRGVEKNNEYTISNRLLGLETISLNGLSIAKDQIVSSDVNSPKVIFWSNGKNGQKAFYYCENRMNPMSCRTIGNKAVSIETLKTLAKDLKQKADEAYLARNIAALTAIAGMALLVFVFATAVSGLAFNLLGIAAIASGVVAVLGGLVVALGKGMSYAKLSKGNFAAKAIVSEKLSSHDDIEGLAQVLHNMLITEAAPSNAFWNRKP